MADSFEVTDLNLFLDVQADSQIGCSLRGISRNLDRAIEPDGADLQVLAAVLEVRQDIVDRLPSPLRVRLLELVQEYYFQS